MGNGQGVDSPAGGTTTLRGSSRQDLVDHLRDRAKFVRLETLRLTDIAKAGHYTSTFSAAELFVSLYYSQLRIDPARPDWPGRDRFVLSKGHAAIGLYPILSDLGFFPSEWLDTYTRLGSPLGDHPDMRKIPGIDFSSGSLGHGLSVALGMALAGRRSGLGYRTYCMVGDGELCEGQIWEAAMAASHYQVGSLVCIVDRNQLSIDGRTEDVMAVEPIDERFRAFGWDVRRIDGHDLDAILDTFETLPSGDTGPPQLIIADTVKGRGSRRMELNIDWHVGYLVGADFDDVRAEIESGFGPRPAAPVTDHTDREPSTFSGTPATAMPSFIAGGELADLADEDERIVVLTADLASPNRMIDFARRHPERFFNVGIAEKNMLTVAAGMAASGYVPFAATFASFAALLGCEQLRTDCAYPGLPVRVIGHHGGVATGFYGTSHHALEDLAICRAIADLIVVCPTDANMYRAILRASLDEPRPIYMRLGRGRDPEVYPDVPTDFRFGVARRLTEGSELTIIATGTEVAPSLEAAGELEKAGISTRVVDMCTIAPLDRDEVIAAAIDTNAILTVEEHNITGGLGSAVAEVLADEGLGVPFVRHGIHDLYVVLGPPRALYAHYGLDAHGVLKAALTMLADHENGQPEGSG